MRHHLRQLGAAFLALALWLAPSAQAQAQAQGASLFDVDGVSVAVSAASALEAKQKGMADAARDALATVMRRLTRSQDHGRLPVPAQGEVEAMVAGIGVVSETTTGTHYAATLNFRFDPGAVRVLLGHAGIGFVERVAEPVLVVPMLRRGDDLLLAGDNPYLAAWQALDTTNSLTPVRLPDDSLASQGISAQAVLVRDYDAMLTLRYLYDARHILVSECVAGADASVACALRGETAAGAIDVQEAVSGADDMDAALRLAAAQLLARLEDQWKGASALDGGAYGTLDGDAHDSQVHPVSASFEGLREWQDLRARLLAVPGVAEVDVVSLQARGAELRVRFAGGIDELAYMAAAQNLELVDTGGQWSLRAY